MTSHGMPKSQSPSLEFGQWATCRPGRKSVTVFASKARRNIASMSCCVVLPIGRRVQVAAGTKRNASRGRTRASAAGACDGVSSARDPGRRRGCQPGTRAGSWRDHVDGVVRMTRTLVSPVRPRGSANRRRQVRALRDRGNRVRDALRRSPPWSRPSRSRSRG